VDEVVDAIAAIEQTSLSANEDLTVANGWRRKTALVVSRNRVNPYTHIAIEHVALAKPGFVLGS